MTTSELLRLRLTADVDFTRLRHVAARVATLLGLDTADATRVATSVSELGRLCQSEGLSTVSFGLDVDHLKPSVVIAFDFADRGVPGNFGSGNGTFVAVSRLMDEVERRADSITLRKTLPRPIDSGQVATIRIDLLADSPGDLRTMLHSQNQELIATLVALRDREADLLRVNEELEQTNRGVVALYAELEQRSAEVRDAQRAVFEELEDALRPPAPTIEGVELGVRYLPAQNNSPTGGDLYDWFVLPDGSLQISVVDVQGHGVTGTRDALWVTHAIRAVSLEGRHLDQLLNAVDALLAGSNRVVVATSLVARLDPRSGSLQLTGAGHPPALRVSAQPTGEFLDAPGRPLGYPRGGSDGVSQHQLEAGDTVLLYTDGLVESRRDLVEGLNILAAAGGRARHLPLGILLDNIISECVGLDPLRDDTLLLALRWLGVSSDVSGS